MTLDELGASPAFGAGITLIAYAIGTGCQRRWAFAHTLLVTCGLLIGTLLVCRIPYESYRVGGSYVSIFLSPAVVALAVPFYRRAREIGAHLGAIAAASAVGSVVGVMSAWGIATALGAPHNVMVSLLAKSTTTPISMDLVSRLGGVPELGALSSVMCGMLGSMAGPVVLRFCGVRRDLAVGTAMGTSSHGIGTARMIRESELRGGVSGLAMALTGIITTLLVVLLRPWLVAG